MSIPVFYSFPAPFPPTSDGRQGVAVASATSESDAKAQALATVTALKAAADAVSAALADAVTFLTT